MRDCALPIGRPRRYNTTVDEQAAERELGFVGHIKHSLSIASRRYMVGGLPENCQVLPSGAILEPQNRYPRYNRFIRCVSSACRASLKTFEECHLM